MLVASRVLAALWLGEWVGGEKQYIKCTLYRRRRLVQGAADQWCSQPDHHAQTLSAASRARFCLGAASVAGDEDCRAGDLCQCTRLHGRDAQRHRLHRWQWPQRAVCLRARSAWRRSARREARIDSSGAMPEDNLTCRFCFGGGTHFERELPVLGLNSTECELGLTVSAACRAHGARGVARLGDEAGAGHAIQCVFSIHPYCQT